MPETFLANLQGHAQTIHERAVGVPEVHFFAGPTCEPNGNEENAVAAAGRLVFDGIHLVLARGEPVAPSMRRPVSVKSILSFLLSFCFLVLHL